MRTFMLPMEKEYVYAARSSTVREWEGEMSRAGRIIDLHVAVRLKDEAWEQYMRTLDAYQERQTQGTLREVTRARRALDLRKEQWGTAWRLSQLQE